MAVILGAADFDGLEFVVTGDAGDVGPEFGLDRLVQAPLPLFGAEDDVDPQA